MLYTWTRTEITPTTSRRSQLKWPIYWVCRGGEGLGKNFKKTTMTFPEFLAERFAKSMEGLGCLPTPVHTMKMVKDDGNHPLYRLALFSSHKRAYDFWDQVLKYNTKQQNLFNI